MPLQKAFSGGGGGSADLTTEQTDILNALEYDSATNTLSTPNSFEVGLNTFRLGKMHSNSSGGENVFWHNELSGIDWFPVWQGLTHYNKGVNEQVQVHPTARVYGLANVRPRNGVNPGDANIPFETQLTANSNTSVFGLQVRAGEDYVGRLTYTLRHQTEQGLMKYLQRIRVDVREGDLIVFDFDHPQEEFAGAEISVNLVKPNGDSMLVKIGEDNLTPWVLISRAPFTDERIAMRSDVLDLSWQIFNNLHPGVDTLHARDQEVFMTRNGDVIQWDLD